MPRAVVVQAEETSVVEKSVLFIGGSAPHNVQGISWFLKNVWPRVRHECDEASLRVLGSVAHMVDGKHQNVDLVGQVADLTPFYRKSAVCVIPLLSGSGFKTKLIEALGFGKACVSTPTGAVGLAHLPEPPLIITEEESKFAAAVIALLKDGKLRKQYELLSAKYVQKFHSPDAIYNPILEYLQSHCAS
jgi:glycosyltransferase involved in cell wall biosynthesis